MGGLIKAMENATWPVIAAACLVAVVLLCWLWQRWNDRGTK